MPVITCTVIEGYSDETRTLLEERLSDAARITTGAPWDGITVMINELPASDYMRGRSHKVPAEAPPRPMDLARGYLEAMEARDLATARTFLADDFVMTFPGGVRFRRPEELVDWARDRYRSVTKTFEHVDEAMCGDDAVVYCSGTLSGTWPNGETFAGIRFIDRFTVRDGRLSDQRVWNDLAEALRHGD